MGQKKRGLQLTDEVKYTLGEKGAAPEDCAFITLRKPTRKERNEYNEALFETVGDKVNINSEAHIEIFDKLFVRVESLFSGETEIKGASGIPEGIKGDIAVRQMNRSEVIDVKNC